MPYMVDDDYDASNDYAAQWLQYWLVPLFSNENFDDKMLIVLGLTRTKHIPKITVSWR